MRALFTEQSVKTSQNSQDRCWKNRCFNIWAAEVFWSEVKRKADAPDAMSCQVIGEAPFHLHVYKLLQLWNGVVRWGLDAKTSQKKHTRGLSVPPPRPAVMTFMPSSAFGAWMEAAWVQCCRDPRRCWVISLCVCTLPPPPDTHTRAYCKHTCNMPLLSLLPKPLAKKKRGGGFTVCSDHHFKSWNLTQKFSNPENKSRVCFRAPPPPPPPPLQQESDVVSDVLSWLVSCPTTCAAKCLCVRSPLMLNYLRAFFKGAAPASLRRR